MKKSMPITDCAQDAYFVRQCALERLGFKTYKAYLRSILWQKVRIKALCMGYACCRACGQPATQIHHDRYNVEDLDGSCLDHLIPVCGNCHHRAEFAKHGTKIDPQAATSRLDAMQRGYQHARHAKDCWKHFFTILTDIRIYLGMDESFEARTLVEQLDAARAALPKKPTGNRKERRRVL